MSKIYRPDVVQIRIDELGGDDNGEENYINESEGEVGYVKAFTNP